MKRRELLKVFGYTVIWSPQVLAFSRLIKAVPDVLEKEESIDSYLSTGVKAMDKYLGPIKPGELVLIAGRPSTGKTALLTTMALNITREQNAAIAFFSLEMSKESIMTRLLSQASEGRLSDLRTGKLTDVDLSDLTTAAVRLSECPLYLDDQLHLSFNQIQERIVKISKQKKLDAVLVDCVHYMGELSDNIPSFKLLAEKMNISIILNSTIRKNLKKQYPEIGDLKLKSEVTKDIDKIVLLSKQEREDLTMFSTDRIVQLFANNMRKASNLKCKMNIKTLKFS